ncbi:MAG: hypothetical protein JNK82_45760 [Myxococcaceae bacterium]|nr:hypothetical protein [Myxococcaceae bacterium]
MSPGEREGRAQVVEAPAGSGAQKPHERLPQLVALAAGERNLQAQSRLTTDIVETLIAMRAPGDEAAEARVLIAHLDAKELRHLVDEKGRRAHTEAVATLLSLGFPHALQVSPEDLDTYRGTDTLGGAMLYRMRLRRAAGWLTLATYAATVGGWLAMGQPGGLFWVSGTAALGAIGGGMLLGSKPHEDVGLPSAAIFLSGAGALVGCTSWFPLLGTTALAFVASAVARRGSANPADGD